MRLFKVSICWLALIVAGVHFSVHATSWAIYKYQDRNKRCVKWEISENQRLLKELDEAVIFWESVRDRLNLKYSGLGLFWGLNQVGDDYTNTTLLVFSGQESGESLEYVVHRTRWARPEDCPCKLLGTGEK